MRIRSVVVSLVVGVGSAVAVSSAAFAQYGETPEPSVLGSQVATSAPAVLANNTTPASNLPITGSDVAGIAGVAAAACGVGTALVIASRRRNRAAA